MKYYHITHVKNLNTILEDGLKCNESGEIFVFENKSIKYNNVVNTVADIIARNQIGLDEYIMFEIDSEGFETELIHDNVGEISNKQQWFLLQKTIHPRYISLFSKYKTKYTNFLILKDLN